MTALTAAIDVGGTKIAGALLGEHVVYRTSTPTPGPVGAADPGASAQRAVARELADRAAATGDTVVAVGLGCCEYVDADDGEVGRLTSTEVLAWTEQPRDWLPTVFPDARVSVESDVRCGLRAEHRLGVLRGVDSALFVSWGTGLSSALLLHGRIWPGAHGRAIALGELCTWGGTTVEGFASGAGMAARWASVDGRFSTLDEGTRELAAAAAEGDVRAVEIASSSGQALAEALRNAVHLLDPEVVVLGGGLGSTDTVARRAAVQAWQRLGATAPLVFGALGPDAPLLGAGLGAGWRA